MFNKPGNKQASKDVFEGLTLESIIEPFYFEEAKRALIEIFLTIQDELEINYEIFLNENFPEDDPSESRSPKEERKSKFNDDERSRMPSNPHSRPDWEKEKFKSTIISLRKDARSKFINITERFVDNIILNEDENWIEDKPFQLEDISLSGTTATVVFQIGKRLIIAY
jgi:hypothetical protein